MSNLSLPFDTPDESPVTAPVARDEAARAFAVDPSVNVALEASAGTGKTRVLVDRYVNLLRAGVDPAHVLAMTFTRKAATEMRERILASLEQAAERGEIPPSRWRELRDRMADIAVSTIDAFCLSLLREFPLEADLDPGFSVADDAEVPRLVEESLDRALRTCRALAREDENVRLVFAQLGDRRARLGLAGLLQRRLVAPALLGRYVTQGPRDWTVRTVADRGAASLARVVRGWPGGLEQFSVTGPRHQSFTLLLERLRDVTEADGGLDPAIVHDAFVHARRYFLTQDGQPRQRTPFGKQAFARQQDWEHHKTVIGAHGTGVRDAYAAYRRDLNVLVSRGVWRMYRVAEQEYRSTLDAHAVLDFSDLLHYTLRLLGQMEEFSQSRYRLESRYQHVLLDEFQDTSRPQWDLVALLIRAWGEGVGLAHQGRLAPSVFIVGDRKQSIYGFRDADVSVLSDASLYLSQLRQGSDVRRSITRSFRAVPPLLAFVNDVCADIEKEPERADAFGYGIDDVFPVDEDANPAAADPVVGLLAGPDAEACAAATATEIGRLIDTGVIVRDRTTGLHRAIRPADVAILFRTRESHREFERALEARGLRSYVYKGLGFFDADEIKDALALLWYLAEPGSDLRVAAWLRSRFVRLSDEGLLALSLGGTQSMAPRRPTGTPEVFQRQALSLGGTQSMAPGRPTGTPEVFQRQALALAIEGGELARRLSETDRVRLQAARGSAARWLHLVDRLPPAELFDVVLRESAYAYELRGARVDQARENLKKLRALLRRMQNRGYLTLARLVAHLDRLAVGDESNAAIDAVDAVSLMTIHAAKGLEFPVVFVVNLSRGTGNRRLPMRVAAAPGGADASVSIGDFLSEADEDNAAKEREETKRLLYVALTRARDRLYLSSILKDGTVPKSSGSLAEVLPPSLLDCLCAAGKSDAERRVPWQSRSGAVHTLQVCGAAVVAELPPARVEAAAAPAAGDDDFASLDLVSDRLRASAVATEAAGEGDENGRGPSDARLGTLVHRLFQDLGVRPDAGQDQLVEAARRLALPWSPDQASEETLERAATLYAGLCAHPQVAAVYGSSEILHEVPFALSEEGRIVRGTIDCLARTATDEVTVLEFKTGRPRPWHQEQLRIYQKAAQALFPANQIVAQVVYTK
jgi:ATP-dependent helicase/nuclease subunit A